LYVEEGNYQGGGKTYEGTSNTNRSKKEKKRANLGNDRPVDEKTCPKKFSEGCLIVA